MHCGFSVRCPVEVGFDHAKDADVVCPDLSACVDPVRPIVIRANSSGILKGNTECGGCVGGMKGNH